MSNKNISKQTIAVNSMMVEWYHYKRATLEDVVAI